MMMYLLTATVITLTMTTLSSILMLKKNYKEKASSFECGFDPSSKSRLPFSIHFFLIAVIFLIFDVEITMMVPMPITPNYMNTNLWYMINSTFIVILVAGVIHEWKQGALQWAI